MPYTIPPHCARHILDGSLSGGGHRHGAGRGKSEFPASWSDRAILTRIKEVADDPASASTRARGGRLKIDGTRAGVRIRVIADPASWTIITGYPI